MPWRVVDRRRPGRTDRRVGPGAGSRAAVAHHGHQLDQAGTIRVELVVEERQPETRRGSQRLHRSRGGDGLGVRAGRRQLEPHADRHHRGRRSRTRRRRTSGLFFWYNSGGPHNDVTEAPRDRMFTRDARRAEFQKLKAWGVKGVKVDFWQSDKQDRIAQYRDLLKDAADFQLMVNFHGSTIPRGWSREFPNLIGMEAVAGAEQYKFNEDYAGAGAVAQHGAALHAQRRRADGLHAGHLLRREVSAPDHQRARARAVDRLRDADPAFRRQRRVVSLAGRGSEDCSSRKCRRRGTRPGAQRRARRSARHRPSRRRRMVRRPGSTAPTLRPQSPSTRIFSATAPGMPPRSVTAQARGEATSWEA